MFIIVVGFHRIFFQTSGAVFISFVCLLLSRKKVFVPIVRSGLVMENILPGIDHLPEVNSSDKKKKMITFL